MTAPCILLVDDEPMNIEILSESLQDAGYDSISAADGVEAWKLLEQFPARFDSVVLDRMMPRMDGMQLLARMKANSAFAFLPVILQTARSTTADVLDGIRAGAFYYLCKPYDISTFIAIVRAAVDERHRYRSMVSEAGRVGRIASLVTSAKFEFQTLEHARDLTALFSRVTPDAERLSIGLMELLLNAVEHGNLAISYEEKSALVTSGQWSAEIERRLQLPAYRDRHATIEFQRAAEHLNFRIADQGGGFDWKRYLDFDPERAFAVHGRGIAIARQMCFDTLEYVGNGSEVHVSLRNVQAQASGDATAIAA